jgi:hypothetical protein
MNSRVHGVVSMLIITAATLVAVLAARNHSALAGIAYGVLLVVSVPIVLFAYCSKCPLRNTGCRHVVIGPMTRLLPRRQTSPYSFLDYIGVTLPPALLVIAAQPFLLPRPGMLAAYWVLLVIGIAEIRLLVCRDCDNTLCPLRRRPAGRISDGA